MTVIGPALRFVPPNHPAFEYSDHAGVSVDDLKARFLRPLAFRTYEYASPAARVRFRTNSATINICLSFNALLTDPAYNDRLSVLVDGVPTDFDPPDNRAGFSYLASLTFPTPDYRNIELIMPYSAGVDFLGVEKDPAADIRLCRPRPSGKLLCIGDSITQGFYTTASRFGYAHLLGNALGMQTVNMGFGSSQLTTHGACSYGSAIDPDVVTVLLGYNDFGNDQPSQAAFKARYTTTMQGLLDNTSADIFAITPTWTSAVKAIPIGSYRTWATEAVAAIGSGRITTVDGLSLATNSMAHFPDGTHGNDAANASIASKLALIIG